MVPADFAAVLASLAIAGLLFFVAFKMRQMQNPIPRQLAFLFAFYFLQTSTGIFMVQAYNESQTNFGDLFAVAHWALVSSTILIMFLVILNIIIYSVKELVKLIKPKEGAQDVLNGLDTI